MAETKGATKRFRLLSFYLVSLVLVAAALVYLDFNPFDFFFGLASAGDLINYSVPPDFSSLPMILRFLAESFSMAFIGTVFGVLLAIPLAFLMSEKTQSNKFIRSVAQAVAIFSRSVPDLLFAYIAVGAIGIGPLAGTIAIALGSVGMVAKLSATSIENTPSQPFIALSGLGATKLQQIFSGFLPELAPNFIATALYRFDINLRSSAILGLVGAGGIGLMLRTTLGQLDYRGAMAVVCAIFVLLLVTEFISIYIRKLITEPPHSGFENRVVWNFESRVVWNKVPFLSTTTFSRLRTLTLFGLFSVTLIYSIKGISPGFENAFSENDRVWKIFGQLIRPNFEGYSKEFGGLFLETIAMALLATFFGGFVGIAIGVLAARNSKANKSVYFLARGLMVAKRGFPTIVFALIFVAAVGLGSTAGVMALTFGTGIIFAKFVADSLEDLDHRPAKATLASGATRLQSLVATIMPQALPTITLHYLYTFDINIRASTILGIVGAGGIGYELILAMRARDFETVSAIMIGIFAIITVVEKISKTVSKSLL